MFLLFTVCKQCQVSTQVSTLALALPQTALYEVVYSKFLLRKRYFVLNIIHSHSLTYVRVAFRGTLSKSNFTQVGISLNSIQFNSISFISCAKKNCTTKCTIQRLRQHCLCVFAVLVRSSTYFLQDANYVSTVFLSLCQAQKCT